MPLARLPSYLQCVCFVLVAIVAQPTPDGVSMCFLSAARACVLPQHALRQRVPQCPESRHIFLSSSAWDDECVTCSVRSSTICSRLKGHGAGGLSGRSRGLFGPRVDFQCDSWSLNPAGYGRLTPGLSRCTSQGLFFTFCCLLPEGLNQLLFWCTKTTLLLRNLFKSFPHYRWKLFLLSSVSPRCLRFP